MNRIHPTTPAGHDTKTHLPELLQAILAFAILSRHPKVEREAVSAVGHIATSADLTCRHPQTVTDDNGDWVCCECLETVGAAEVFGIASPSKP